MKYHLPSQIKLINKKEKAFFGSERAIRISK